MSFAKNLIYIRQHYNVTQEELAEQLGVSRQTVSKWESGINFPETDKLIQICNLYHTNLDDLMRGSVEVANVHDTELYDTHMSRHSLAMALGTGLVILGCAALILLDALGVSDNLSTAGGLIFIAVAAFIFIVNGMGHSQFKKRHTDLTPQYSPEQLERSEQKFRFGIAGGSALAVLDVILLILFVPDEDEVFQIGGTLIDVDIFMSFFLAVIAVAATILVYTGMQKSKYNLSEMEAVTPEELESNNLIGSVCGVIMLVAVAVFLIGGFVPGFDPNESLRHQAGFAVSWIAFPIGGLLCGAAALIISAFKKKPQDKIVQEAKKENPWLKVEDKNKEED